MQGDETMKQHEYLSINDLAKYLNMGVTQVRIMAKSQRLRKIKGAVINVNAAGGKNEVLRINVQAAIKAFEAQPD
jgi:hypothetical protein